MQRERELVGLLGSNETVLAAMRELVGGVTAAELQSSALSIEAFDAPSEASRRSDTRRSDPEAAHGPGVIAVPEAPHAPCAESRLRSRHLVRGAKL